jgi:hypothetical protein
LINSRKKEAMMEAIIRGDNIFSNTNPPAAEDRQ